MPSGFLFNHEYDSFGDVISRLARIVIGWNLLDFVVRCDILRPIHQSTKDVPHNIYVNMYWGVRATGALIGQNVYRSEENQPIGQNIYAQNIPNPWE